jgi:ribonuclease HI
MHIPASNNAAEYEALLHGLRIATTLGIRRLKVLGDFMLVSIRPPKSGRVWMTK